MFIIHSTAKYRFLTLLLPLFADNWIIFKSGN